ncbi:hypothetical protein FG93_05759 [Bosea sp. LC85]|uniref:DUF2934 domain-containing protein n=1 Tax=Bosea sp. LC85 TaxID=1502851 RepID=UPI0004E29C98|nr:DUF2934 domain-containing protein [Bosea sp. LC85]KFC63633.1 hypothetical protein FG93_05759 [Bosea sp. LC85]
MASKDSAQREIRKIAYALWMEQGQPDGRDREHWEAAKVIWAFRNHENQDRDSELKAGSHAARPLTDRR